MTGDPTSDATTTQHDHEAGPGAASTWRDWAELIRDVPDFPKAGVVFKDITPLLASPAGFAAVVDELVERAPVHIDVVVGMEARGFIFGAPVALRLGASFVPIRKAGKLPAEVITETYDLEYGTETLAVHRDAISPGARVLIIDDVLATGGTIGATAELVRKLGARLVAVTVVLELDFLDGRERLAGLGIDQLVALRSTAVVEPALPPAEAGPADPDS